MYQILTITTRLNEVKLHVDKNIHIIREELFDGYKKLIVEDAKTRYKPQIDEVYDKHKEQGLKDEEIQPKIKINLITTYREIPSTNKIESLTKEEIFGEEK